MNRFFCSQTVLDNTSDTIGTRLSLRKPSQSDGLLIRYKKMTKNGLYEIQANSMQKRHIYSFFPRNVFLFDPQLLQYDLTESTFHEKKFNYLNYYFVTKYAEV